MRQLIYDAKKVGIIQHISIMVFSLIVSLHVFAGTVGGKGEEGKEKWRFPPNSHYSLVLFFSSRCPHCQHFAPVIAQVADEIGLPIVAYSIDGGSLPELPTPHVVDASTGVDYFGYRIVQVPTLFLLNTDTSQVYRVSVGYLSTSRLENRLAKVSQDIFRAEPARAST